MIGRRDFCLSLLGAASAACHGFRPSFAQVTSEFICATIDRLPGEFVIENQSGTSSSSKLEFDNHRRHFDLTDYGVSYFEDRWRRADGLTPNHPNRLITLGVFFMDGSSAQHEAFRTAASQWLDTSLGQLIRFDFSVSQEQSQLRVSFSPAEGNYSYVGRNNLKIPLQRKTMNIANMVNHTMMHEIGHALGLQHEHFHPNSGIVWNEQVVIADMDANGWPEAMTRAQILTRYTQAATCVGNRNFDDRSVMLYPIPARWTKNGFSSVDNIAISDGDRRCLTGLYSL
jgi:hypothetical protein